MQTETFRRRLDEKSETCIFEKKCLIYPMNHFWKKDFRKVRSIFFWNKGSILKILQTISSTLAPAEISSNSFFGLESNLFLRTKTIANIEIISLGKHFFGVWDEKSVGMTKQQFNQFSINCRKVSDFDIDERKQAYRRGERWVCTELWDEILWNIVELSNKHDYEAVIKSHDFQQRFLLLLWKNKLGPWRF